MRARRLRSIGWAIAALATALAVPVLSVAGPRTPPRAGGTQTPKPTPAAPSTGFVDVTVVQVAGTRAYLKPGARAGVRRGARVVIDHQSYRVSETTDSYAVIEVGNEAPHERDTGQATVVAAEEEHAKQLPKPRPVTQWEHAWPSAAAPADSQTPRFVPLGSTQRDRRWDVRLSMSAGGVLPLVGGGGIAQAELNARVHAEPFQGPGALDLDASLQRWFAADLATRNGADTRALLWLRELLLSRDSGAWYAGVGRMRYAASTLGPLDGAAAHIQVGEGFFVGAFGGLLPNPLSGAPSLDAERFGMEATYRRPELALRPEAALVVHGSTFRGALDERRLSGTFGVYPGLSRIGGYFELSNFSPNNPWGASTVELTAAGFDASVHAGVVSAGARLDVLQPVRSLWMAYFLPTSWLCRTLPTIPPEPCDGSVSTRAVGSIDAGVELDNVSVTVGGTTTRDLTQVGGAPSDSGAFAAGRVVRIGNVGRIEASGSYSTATYLNMVSGSAGPGLTLMADALDVAAYYRVASLRYRVQESWLVQQGGGATAAIFPNDELALTLQTEVTTGPDTKALLVFATVVWHPHL
jgi:hypothetical protein